MICAFVTVLSVRSARNQTVTAPPLAGYVSHEWGADEHNPCVPDVHAALAGLRSHGDIMGFQMNGTQDVSLVYGHWQGIQRPMSGSGQYLYASRSGAHVAFVIVKMESRNTSRMRLRSNRLNPALRIHETPPPAADRIMKEIASEPGFDHAGGMQIIGNILAVPFEDHKSSSRVVLYDVTDPENPQKFHFLDHSNVTSPSDPGQGSAVGITKLQDGRFLLVVGVHSSKVLDFYVSNTTSLRDPALKFERFHTQTGGLVGGFQNLNFINQCDGKIFLVGTHNTGWPPPSLGTNHVRWYLLRNGSANSLAIEEMGGMKLHCEYPTGSLTSEVHCNFGAGGGLYIDPGSQVYIYGVEHDNDGPAGSVKVEEFRASRPTTATRIEEGWVELYEDFDFEGRSVMIDFPDRQLENYADFDRVERFDETASSAKWSIPAGWRFRLYDQKSPCG
ncbi:MAG: hypothetical protein ACREOO_10890, partial [bacterium]